MTPLAIVLIAKISISFLVLVIPFLLFPASKLDQLSNFNGAPVFYRLYGMAILALLVGYSGGLYQVMNGDFPEGRRCHGAHIEWRRRTNPFADG